MNMGLPRWLGGKESACQRRKPGFDPWVGKIPWRRAWQPTPVFWPGESHRQRSLAGYSPWGHEESDTTEWLTLWLFIICIISLESAYKQYRVLFVFLCHVYFTSMFGGICSRWPRGGDSMIPGDHPSLSCEFTVKGKVSVSASLLWAMASLAREMLIPASVNLTLGRRQWESQFALSPIIICSYLWPVILPEIQSDPQKPASPLYSKSTERLMESWVSSV